MSESHATAYRSLRARIGDVVKGCDPTTPAPATPEWSVHDVVAHLVGVSDDVVNGRLDGVATDPWTAAQVDARRDASIDDMLSEWDEKGPPFETMLASVPTEIAGQALFDAMTHEQDIRHALRRPGGRDADAVDLAWEWIAVVRTQGEAPAIRVVTDRGAELIGTGEPIATVEAPRFEILRAFTGRRSAKEIEAYGWTPPPARPELLLAAPIFTLRTEPLNE
jgi:uncharacterized protein (TIGR03083 family)